MSIKIEMRDGKWRMGIESEFWEFENKEDMLNELNNLLTLKDNHGRLKDSLHDKIWKNNGFGRSYGYGKINVQGCGKFVKFWNRNCGQIEDLKHSDHIILCDDCKNELNNLLTLKNTHGRFYDKI